MTILGTVVREPSTPLGTRGSMLLGNGFGCDTLELPWHDNERGRSCTLADTYVGRVWLSPMLRRLVIRYEDKNGRHDCLVHNMNFAADATDIDGDGVPEITQVHGCTGVGRGFGDIARPDGHRQWGILNSVVTLGALIESLKLPGGSGLVNVHGFADGYDDVEITYSWRLGTP